MLVVPLVVFAKPLTTKELEIPELPYTMQIDYFANLYGADSSIVKKVVECESQWNEDALGDGGRSYGLGQFQKQTWNALVDEYQKQYNEELNYKSSHDQLKLLTFSISEGHGSHWTAYRAIKNGGTYKFYSNQLKKNFIVKCKL